MKKIKIHIPDPGKTPSKILNDFFFNYNLDNNYVICEGHDEYGEIYDVNVILLAEHNGTFSWRAKRLVDSIQKHSIHTDNKFILIGYSGGKFGNIIGIEHMKMVLSSLGAQTIKGVALPNLYDYDDILRLSKIFDQILN